MKGTFETFLQEIKSADDSRMTNPRKFQRLIELKKLFSIPWLLAHDVLFEKQDFYKKVCEF